MAVDRNSQEYQLTLREMATGDNNQQVGRAGRAVEEAYGILLHGEEDDRIADYFLRTAFPPQDHVKAILDLLDEVDGGLSLGQLEARLNLRRGELLLVVVGGEGRQRARDPIGGQRDQGVAPGRGGPGAPAPRGGTPQKRDPDRRPPPEPGAAPGPGGPGRA